MILSVIQQLLIQLLICLTLAHTCTSKFINYNIS